MNTQANTNNELLTLKTVSDLTKFLNAIDTADNAESTRFYETEKAISLLKILRGQYTTLQHGNATGAANVGELPNSIYKPVIQSLYDGKKQTAELENREFTLQFEGYRDNQVRQLKYYIETGELFNRKKETQQEKALLNIAKLEKKAAAEAKAKLVEAKAKAEALTRGKANNTKAEPKLDFKVLNFSQDCKDTAAMILEELEREATSAAELLYLAKLILDKYNK